MRMEYRVTLPDHDWVVAKGHKLIPSVYAGIRIAAKTPIGQPDAVTYSGPTYVAIRSGKHSSSTAATHAQDFETLLTLDSFKDIMKTGSGEVKPVVIITVDGGPDENPRYPKVIAQAVKKFKDHNLDFLVAVTNAPGRSAFNRAERRMAPLSRMLAGLILPHDHFGSHLDSRCHTVDEDLEKKNFKYAGDTLAEVWSTLVVDNASVTAQYVCPDEVPIAGESGDPGSVWYAAHVRESQYMLQISKCLDSKCCSKLRSKLRVILPDGFFPPPLLLTGGLDAAAPLSAEDCHYCPLFIQLATKIDFPDHTYEEIPYDFYCPSVQSQLKTRCCTICGLYFASQTAMKEHKRIAHSLATLVDIQDANNPARPARRSVRLATRNREVLIQLQDEMGTPLDVEWVTADPQEDPDSDPEDDIPLIQLIGNVNDWAESPWTLDKEK